MSTRSFDFDYLTKGSKLNFMRKINPNTGEIEVSKYGTTELIAKFNGLKFVIKENTKLRPVLIVIGSLHKFNNDGEHNYDDFGINELHTIIPKLCSIIKVSEDKLTIHNLEFAVNVIPPVPTKQILRGLMNHHGKSFKTHKNYNIDYFQVEHKNYIIKVYDKAKHYRTIYPINNEIIRFEIKHTRMHDLIVLLKDNLISSKVFLLKDLLNVLVLEKLGERLLKIWNEIIFYDYTIDENKLKRTYIHKLPIWQNPYNWELFKPKKRFDENRKLSFIIENYSKKIKLEIESIIREKVNELVTPARLY